MLLTIILAGAVAVPLPKVGCPSGYRSEAYCVPANGKAPVAARWKPEFADNPNKDWFEAQRDCNGLRCCGVSDGEPYYGGYELLSDGSVQLDDGTQISACQVLHGPNPTGHAIRWRRYGHTYCFAPGSGS